MSRYIDSELLEDIGNDLNDLCNWLRPIVESLTYLMLFSSEMQDFDITVDPSSVSSLGDNPDTLLDGYHL